MGCQSDAGPGLIRAPDRCSPLGRRAGSAGGGAGSPPTGPRDRSPSAAPRRVARTREPESIRPGVPAARRRPTRRTGVVTRGRYRRPIRTPNKAVFWRRVTDRAGKNDARRSPLPERPTGRSWQPLSRAETTPTWLLTRFRPGVVPPTFRRPAVPPTADRRCGAPGGRFSAGRRLSADLQRPARPPPPPVPELPGGGAIVAR